MTLHSAYHAYQGNKRVAALVAITLVAVAATAGLVLYAAVGRSGISNAGRRRAR